LGAGLSALLHAFVHGLEDRSLTARLNRLAADRVEVLRGRILRSTEALHAIAALHATRGDRLTRDEFRAFCDASLPRQSELFALAWSPVVADADRDASEQDARRAGWPDFRFTELGPSDHGVRAARREQYVPVYYIEPPVRNGEAIGFDLASCPVRGRALDAARDTGELVATPPLRLVQAGDDRLGILVYLPVYHGRPTDVAARRAALLGYASAVFRVNDLAGSPAVTAGLADEGLGVRVVDEGAVDAAPPLFARPPDARRPAAVDDVVGQARLELAGLRWRLDVVPTRAVIATAHGQSQTILVMGLALTLPLAGLLFTALRRTEVVERRVVERTVSLAAEVRVRKRAVEAAQLAEARYRGIFEHAVEGVFQTTPDGHYISANPALARIYGYESPDQLIRDLSDIEHRLYVDARRRAEFVRQVQQNGSVTAFESEVYRRDRSVIRISENARAVRDAAGHVAYYEGTVVDVTARRQHQDDLERRVRERTEQLGLSNQALRAEVAVRKSAEARAAAASQAKTRFLANMSHEIRTPMNAILGYAQILRRDASLREGQRDAMETILASGNHLMALIDGILDLSKIEAGHVELSPVEFDLGRQVDEVAAMFRQAAAGKGLALRVEGPAGDAAHVVGDQGKLRQVLINLVGNAVKFTDRGEVCLRVGLGADGLVRAAVSDSGPGIARDAHDLVFEPFQQSAAGLAGGGTGLGLAISRQYVELMGGRLSLRSEPGRGATFSFDVPMKRRDAADAPELREDDDAELDAAVDRLPASPAPRALVVDDVKANRDVLALILADAGCHVETAADGQAALELLSGQTFDVAFVDIRMPGIDGVETVRRIADLGDRRPARLVATTASAFADEHSRYLAAGFDEILAKPLRTARVRRCLAALSDSPQPRAELPQAPAACDASHFDAAALPPDVADRLAAAAEICDVTGLKRCVGELELLAQGAGAPPGPLLRELKRRMKNYDLAGVRELLRRHAAATAGAQ
jgi:PAS domain S-box-containing protein